MQNYVQKGETVTLTAPYDRNSGQGAMVGSVFGVASATYTSGTSGEFMTEGVFDLDKTSAQAWTAGQKIYWDNANKRCDSTATVGPLIGVATQIAANPSSTGRVLLGDVVNTLTQPAIANIATADATDLPSAQTLANANKAALNSLLAALRLAGVISP